MIAIPQTKDRVAIVAIGYNRLESMKRLLGSLLKASYTVDDVPLVISIDASGDTKLYDYVRSFEWPFGPKYVNIQTERLGLLKHVLQCGGLTNFFKAVILLEDDIYVSEFFYDYVINAVDYYYEDDRIGGISLYRNEMGGTIPIALPQDGKDVFLRQSVASWGECWTDKMWADFQQWFDNPANQDLSSVDMPDSIKGWKKAWSKFYMAYQIVNDKFFIFPSVSLTTCFSEAGEHGFDSTIGQVTLLSGPKDFKFVPFEEMTKYDIYGTDSRVYKWIGIKKDDLMVSFRSEHPNVHGKRFILSPYCYPYSVVKAFGLNLFPIELNVKYALPGEGLYLYDTSVPGKNGKNPPLTIAYYYLRNFNIRLLARYVVHYTTHAVGRKLKGIFNARKHK